MAEFMVSHNTNTQSISTTHKQSYEWCVEEAGDPVYLFF